MSEGLNKCMLLGNLCADPELRFTQGGTPVLNLRLATNESYLDKDRQRQERTDFHNVIVWGKRGEALAKILAKGSSIFVEGSIRTSSYEDREGQKRYKTEIVATNVLLTGGRGRGAGDEAGQDDGAQSRGRPASGNRGRPAGQAPSAPTPSGQAEPYNGGDSFAGQSDDDIPF